MDNCDPDRLSKIEILGICRDFGYTAVSTLWFKMLSLNPKHANFHQIIDDDVAMFMTDLVQGHEEIHIYVDHPVDELEELKVEDIKPLKVLQPGEEPSVEPLGAEVGNDRALDVIDLKVVEVDDSVDYNDHASYYKDEVDSKGDVSDHYYDYNFDYNYNFEDDYNYNFDFHDNDNWHRQNNEDYRHDSGEFVGHDNEEYDNDNHDDPIEEMLNNSILGLLVKNRSLRSNMRTQSMKLQRIVLTLGK